LFDLGLINGIRSWGYYESGSDSLTGAMTDAPIAPGEGTRATRLITVLLPTGTAAAAPHTRPLRQPRAARMSFQLSIGWWKAKRQRSKP
jgi:hypothetical protein